MKGKYPLEYIKERLKVMEEISGNPDSNTPSFNTTIFNKLSYEFGIPLGKFNHKMSNRQIVQTVFENQSLISPLERDIGREVDYYEGLRAA